MNEFLIEYVNEDEQTKEVVIKAETRSKATSILKKRVETRMMKMGAGRDLTDEVVENLNIIKVKKIT